MNFVSPSGFNNPKTEFPELNEQQQQQAANLAASQMSKEFRHLPWDEHILSTGQMSKAAFDIAREAHDTQFREGAIGDSKLLTPGMGGQHYEAARSGSLKYWLQAENGQPKLVKEHRDGIGNIVRAILDGSNEGLKPEDMDSGKWQKLHQMAGKVDIMTAPENELLRQGPQDHSKSEVALRQFYEDQKLVELEGLESPDFDLYSPITR